MKYNPPEKRLVNGSADLLQSIKQHIPASRLAAGSIKNKYPVPLSDGKTVVYCSDKNQIKQVKEKWEKIIRKQL